jgi:ubiquinone/menaquinone biosynthesis C-methylase UbiE
MGIGRTLLLRAFGRPRGLLGRLGGLIMARTNRRHAAWTIEQLDVRPHDRVLDVGFGPGVAVELLAASAHCVGGVDPSPEMLRQATKRNAEAMGNGRIELRPGCAGHLPYAAESFDKAMALNSMQVWPDALAGLREMWRVLKPGGRVALAFTRHSGQRCNGVPDAVVTAGFTDWRIIGAEDAFCVVAERP